MGVPLDPIVASVATKALMEARAAIAQAKSANARTMTPGPAGQVGKDGANGLDGAAGKDGQPGIDGRDGADGKPGSTGPSGPSGKDGKKGDTGKQGPPGKDGKDGLPGKDGQDGKPGPKGAPGKQGEKGDTPGHEWIGTGLRFEKPDGTWGDTVDLRGPKGGRGDRGASGGGGGGGSAAPGFDPSGLALATNEVPEEFVVKQGAAWVRATYAQMQSWFPYGALPLGTVTVNGAPVTVNGAFVTVT